MQTLFILQMQQQQQSSSADQKNPHNYRPNPADLSNLTLSKEMMNLAERLVYYTFIETWHHFKQGGRKQSNIREAK